MAKEYAAVPLDEEGRIEPPRRKLPLRTIALAAICAVIFGLLSFLAGYAMGRAGSPTPQAAMAKADEDGRLPPEAFVPQSMKRPWKLAKREANDDRSTNQASRL